MPPKRPAPLSDDLFAAAQAAQAHAQSQAYLGATYNGNPLPVKNTFIDVPSGLTPSSMKPDPRSQVVFTAPADLGQPQGFIHRSMLTASAMPHGVPLAPSPKVAIQNPTPMGTPSPTSGPAVFHQWVVSSGTRWPAAYPVQPGQMSISALTAVSQVAGTTMVQKQVIPEDVKDEDEDDDEDSDDGLTLPQHLRHMADAPKPPDGALHPSLGSEAHLEGTCKRCCFFPRGRCANGYNCEFCHYEHEKRKRKNKKKKKKDSAGSAVTTSVVTVTSAAVQGPDPRLRAVQVQVGPVMQLAPMTSMAAMHSAPMHMQRALPESRVHTVTAEATSVLFGTAPPAPQHHYVFDQTPLPQAYAYAYESAPGHVIYGPTQVPGHSVLPVPAGMPQPAIMQHQLIHQQPHLQHVMHPPQPVQFMQMPPHHQAPPPQYHYVQMPQSHAPTVHLPVEQTPPPPMLSPNLRQMNGFSGMLPPPSSSPKGPRH